MSRRQVKSSGAGWKVNDGSSCYVNNGGRVHFNQQFCLSRPAAKLSVGWLMMTTSAHKLHSSMAPSGPLVHTYTPLSPSSHLPCTRTQTRACISPIMSLSEVAFHQVCVVKTKATPSPLVTGTQYDCGDPTLTSHRRRALHAH